MGHQLLLTEINFFQLHSDHSYGLLPRFWQLDPSRFQRLQMNQSGHTKDMAEMSEAIAIASNIETEWLHIL